MGVFLFAWILVFTGLVSILFRQERQVVSTCISLPFLCICLSWEYVELWTELQESNWLWETVWIRGGFVFVFWFCNLVYELIISRFWWLLYTSAVSLLLGYLRDSLSLPLDFYFFYFFNKKNGFCHCFSAFCVVYYYCFCYEVIFNWSLLLSPCSLWGFSLCQHHTFFSPFLLSCFLLYYPSELELKFYFYKFSWFSFLSLLLNGLKKLRLIIEKNGGKLETNLWWCSFEAKKENGWLCLYKQP